MCSQQLSLLYKIDNSLMSKYYFSQLGSSNNTGVSKQNTHTNTHQTLRER